MVLFADKIEVQLSEAMVKKIFSFRQLGKSKESGGIIIGRKQICCSRYDITMITKPSISDIASRFSFVRDGKHAQKVVNRRNKISNGEENYLGEWHTHPEKIPHYSETDLALLMKIRADGTCKFGNPIMIIIGIEAFCLLFFDESNKIGTLDVNF